MAAIKLEGMEPAEVRIARLRAYYSPFISSPYLGQRRDRGQKDGRSRKPRPVRNVRTGGVYSDVQLASDMLGVSAKAIVQAANQRAKGRDRMWEWAD